MGFYWAARVHGQFQLGCILLLIIMLKCAFGFHCFQMLGRKKRKKKTCTGILRHPANISAKKKESVEFNGHKDAMWSVKQSAAILTQEITPTLYAERLDSVRQIKYRLNLQNL